MTPQEALMFCKVFGKEIGPNARVWISVAVDISEKNKDKLALMASAYDNWPRDDARVTYFADTFEDVCSGIKAEWEKAKDRIAFDKKEKLALEIIKITDAKGKCTDADLRLLWSFSAKDIDDLSESACEAANRMAGRGPFSVIKTSGSNGSPKLVEVQS